MNMNVTFEFVRVFHFDNIMPIYGLVRKGKGLYSFNFQTLETRNYF